MRTLAKILIGVLLIAPVAHTQSAFSLEVWMKLDSGRKAALIRGFIANAKEDKIILRRSPLYYVMEVDALIENLVKKGDVNDVPVAGFSADYLDRVARGTTPTTVPAGHYFVMGEQRVNQDISEYTGLHPAERLERVR